VPNLRLFAVILTVLTIVTSGHGRADECDRLLKIDDQLTTKEMRVVTADLADLVASMFDESKVNREKNCERHQRSQTSLENLRNRREELERVCGSRLTQDCNSKCWEEKRVEAQPRVDAACVDAEYSDEEWAAKEERERQERQAEERKAEDAQYDKPEKLVKRKFNLGEQQYTFHLPASYKEDKSMAGFGTTIHFRGPLLWQGFTLSQSTLSLDGRLESLRKVYAEDLKRPEGDPRKMSFSRTKTGYSFDDPTTSVLVEPSQCPTECTIEIRVDTKGTSGKAILKALKQDLENGKFVTTVPLPAQKLERTSFNIKDCKYTFRLPKSLHYVEMMSKKDLGELYFSDDEFNSVSFKEMSDTELDKSFTNDTTSGWWSRGQGTRQKNSYLIENSPDDSRFVAKNPCVKMGLVAVDVRVKLATGKAILKAMKEDIALGKFASIVPRTKNQIKRDNEEAKKRQDHENHNACLMLMSAADRLPEEEVRTYLKQCSSSDTCSIAKEEMQEKSKVSAADLNCKS
jgi:hypothetical protein